LAGRETKNEAGTVGKACEGQREEKVQGGQIKCCKRKRRNVAAMGTGRLVPQIEKKKLWSSRLGRGYALKCGGEQENLGCCTVARILPYTCSEGNRTENGVEQKGVRNSKVCAGR